MSYDFTQDWSKPTRSNTPQLMLQWPQGAECLEIGTFEARYTVWLADTYGHLPNFTVDTIDPYDAAIYGIPAAWMQQIQQRMWANHAACEHANKILPHHKPSHIALAEFITQGRTFDFIYVDGAHHAAQVLLDLCMSWCVLRQHGVMLLDDAVSWKSTQLMGIDTPASIATCPRMAVDTFIHNYWDQLEVLDMPQPYQVAIRKTHT